MTFTVPTLDDIAQPALAARLQHLLDNKTKPLGSLGRLEALALRIGEVLGTEAPALLHRQLAVEELPRVRPQIERQLRELGQPPAPPEEPQRPRERTPMRGGL